MSDFNLACACCSITLVSATNSNIGSWRGVARSGGLSCGACGCQLRIPGAPEDAVCVGPPKVTSIDVATGPAAGGTAVTLSGHALDIGSLQVFFGETPGVNLRSVTDGSAVVDSPAHDAGVVDVSVRNQYGQRLAGGTLSAAFTYEAAP